MVAIVMVAASGVGNMALNHAPESVVWRAAGEPRRIDVGVEIQKGDELGAFRLGSTVVMVFQPGAVKLDEAYEVGQVVRMGERMGTARGAGERA
jgi:phosphatidylserine decarboxylase